MGREKKLTAIYHRVMRRENFEAAAKDLFRLLTETQKAQPDKERALYLDIDGHRNKDGGFDADMLELQKEFCLGFLLPYFTEIHMPLGSFRNPQEQENQVPDQFEIYHGSGGKDKSLDDLYLENYSNTEFVSEPDVYEFLGHVSQLLEVFRDGVGFEFLLERAGGEPPSEKDMGPDTWMHGWGAYMRDLIIELFNSFVYGNLISVSAMTRALIESYVYVRILQEDADGGLLSLWCACSLVSGMKKRGEKGKQIESEQLRGLCGVLGLDYEECIERFGKGNENAWLSDVIGKKWVSFRDACEYLGEPVLASG